MNLRSREKKVRKCKNSLFSNENLPLGCGWSYAKTIGVWGHGHPPQKKGVIPKKNIENYKI